MSALTRYSSVKRAGPTRRSTGRPKTPRYSRFRIRCSQPACRKVLVSSVASAARPSAPKTSAGTRPQRRTNASTSPPCVSSNANAARLIAIRARVTIGPRSPYCGVSFDSDRHGSRGFAEGELAVGRGVDDDVVAVGELALQHAHRQRLDQVLLDGPLERPRAVHRVEALASHQLFGRVGELEPHLALGQPLAQPAQLDLDDALDLLQAQRVEDDDLVDAVDQLGPEVRPHGVHDPLADLVFAHAALVDPLRAQVAGHDDDRVAEVDRPT